MKRKPKTQKYTNLCKTLSQHLQSHSDSDVHENEAM